jgi:hypothetical protein
MQSNCDERRHAAIAGATVLVCAGQGATLCEFRLA